ncbi:Cts1p [Pseudohyphozyma bogoriensis]|nr:Cts1p [Pseudohyphozyma bogoriensis]
MRAASLFASLLAIATVHAKKALPAAPFVAYWGSTGGEGTLESYCSLGYYDVINMGFLQGFGATTLDLEIDGCTSSDYSACSTLASQISACQDAGVIITLSLGGATKFDCGDQGCTGDYYFASAAQAEALATTIWEMFFNGGKTTSGVTRPFGTVVLDGIDLDIEMTATGDGQTPQLYYGDFITKLLAYDSDIYIGASPECQWGLLGNNPMEDVLTSGAIDWFFVQFFNNALCKYTSVNFASTFAHFVSVAATNPNGATKVLMGLPGDTESSDSASYYVDPATAISAVTTLRSTYPNAGVGVGVYSASTAVGSTASGSDANWAKKVAAALAAMPASVASSSSAVTSVTKAATTSAVVAVTSKVSSAFGSVSTALGVASVVSNATSSSSSAAGTKVVSTGTSKAATELAASTTGSSAQASTTTSTTSAAGVVRAGLGALVGVAGVMMVVA